jgi:hypothetical protein
MLGSCGFVEHDYRQIKESLPAHAQLYDFYLEDDQILIACPDHVGIMWSLLHIA